jgi:hypothetical protein
MTAEAVEISPIWVPLNPTSRKYTLRKVKKKPIPANWKKNNDQIIHNDRRLVDSIMKNLGLFY